MATSRPRPQVIRLTDAAADRIKYVMANAMRPVVGVRVGVKNGGCAGMAYTMEYATQVGPHDEIVEDKGVRILIDPRAVLFLLGTEMDYRADRMSSGFVFNNPNQTSACGCGESVALTPAAEASLKAAPTPAVMAPDDIGEMFSAFGQVDVRRMFGGAGLFAEGIMFALVIRGVIYLKADEHNAPNFEREGLAPFTYATGHGTRSVMSYRRMPDRLYDDPEELAAWARDALAAARRAGSRKKGRSITARKQRKT
jgi:iron-sulfur cluster assembly protein